MRCDDFQRRAIQFDLRTNRTARFARTDGEVDGASPRTGETGEQRIPVVSEASEKFGATHWLQPCRIANASYEALTPAFERRHLLQRDDVPAGFIENGPNTPRIETTVPADAAMHVVRDDL